MGSSDSKILSAVKADDVAALNEALAEGAQISDIDKDGWSLLHWAVHKKSNAVLPRLLERRILDVNQRSAKGWFSGGFSPLHLAVRNDNVPAVVLLAEAGADLTAHCQSGWPPLAYAVYDNRPAAAESLLMCGASPSALTSGGESCLRMCVKHRHTGVLAVLLSFPVAEPQRVEAFQHALKAGPEALGCVEVLLRANAVSAEVAAAAVTSVGADLRRATERMATRAEQLRRSEELSRRAPSRGAPPQQASAAEAAAAAALLVASLREAQKEVEYLTRLLAKLTAHVAAAAAQVRAPAEEAVLAPAALPPPQLGGRLMGRLGTAVPAAPGAGAGFAPAPISPATTQPVGRAAEPPPGVASAPLAAEAPPAAEAGSVARAGEGASEPAARGESTSCPVCWDADAPKNCALIPCGHVLCGDCAARFLARGERCPMCRTPIARTMKLFL